MLVLAVSYIAFFIVCVLLFNRHGATKWQDNILWGLMAFSMAVIAYLYDPSGTGLDVVRHFQRLELIKQRDVSFIEFMLQDSFGYGGLYVYNAVCYLIAKLNINEHFLPFLVTLTSYLICFYILLDWTQSEGVERKSYALSLLVGTSFMPYYFVMCGIRNGVAMCIMALAVYLYLYKGKSIFLALIIGATAATIHTSTLIAVPFLLLSKLKFNYKSIGLVLIASITVNRIANIAAEMSIPYITSMAKSYLVYSSDAQFRSAQYFLTTDMLLIVAFGILFFLQYGRYLLVKNNGRSTRLYSFIALYTTYIVGNFGNYDLVLRPAYLLGPLAPMLCYLLYNQEFWKRKASIQFITKSGVALISGFTFCRYMAYFFSVVKF